MLNVFHLGLVPMVPNCLEVEGLVTTTGLTAKLHHQGEDGGAEGWVRVRDPKTCLNSTGNKPFIPYFFPSYASSLPSWIYS